MKYKGYALTNFSCNANNVSKVQECYQSAVDLALADEHFDKLGVGFIEDIFYLKTIGLLNPLPTHKTKPFEIRIIEENEPE